MLTAATTTVGFITFCSFAWALKHHFRIEGGMPSRMRKLSACSTAAFLLFVVLISFFGVDFGKGIAAIALFLASGLLFWWTIRATKARPPAIAHTNNVPTMIYADGPYAYVRHPFYLAYSLGWLATALAGGPIQWIPAILLIAWYYKTAHEEEEHFASSDLAAEYARYRDKTGLILPRVL
ncbi:isoprenylcysteine carboxylmethyltransferase family protein [Roseomonas sp. KE2513]|nr:isoprenylcysteine carboxylmethyltransferase family protein [Roseomonas sp. KE2513]